MKAKSSFSGIAAGTTARGAIVVFSAITIFIVGFVAWSAAGVGGAIIEFLRKM